MPTIVNSRVSGGSSNYIGSSTWAARPTSANVGDVLLVTDIGISPGALMTWTSGSIWRPIAPVPLLNQTTSITKTDTDTAWQNGVSVTLPAGLMYNGSAIRCDYILSCNNSVAGSKEIRWLWDSATINNQSYNPAGSQDFRGLLQAQVINSTTALGWWQGQSGVFGSSAPAYTAATINTAVSQVITCDFRFGTAGAGSNILTLRALKVWMDP
jgi:hypothetical protein